MFTIYYALLENEIYFYICTLGEFSASPGSSSCQSCPVGTYTDAVGKSACTKCPKGQYTNTVKSIACKKCAAGEYQVYIQFSWIFM